MPGILFPLPHSWEVEVSKLMKQPIFHPLFSRKHPTIPARWRQNYDEIFMSNLNYSSVPFAEQF